MHYQVVVIGGGAAGFFGAIVLAEALPGIRILITEQGKNVLEKVRISGGGRCNVTNGCEDPSELVNFYPRGQKELLGPFYHFGPSQMKAWLTSHGVQLKEEDDGRVFPASNTSETIIDCFTRYSRQYQIDLVTSSKVTGITHHNGDPYPFQIHTKQRVMQSQCLLVTPGSQASVWKMLEQMGHRIVPPVPSLFTFQIRDPRIRSLAGIQVPHARVSIRDTNLEAEGPLLITHWGVSGPAILKLSSWGARILHERHYRFELQIDWNPAWNLDEVRKMAINESKRQVKNTGSPPVPRRLWHALLQEMPVLERNWNTCTPSDLQQILDSITTSTWQVTGKATFKEEFVTSGGVDLKEVDFKTFRSRKVPGLYLAGEVLNIDALTGGFNFQAAWTGAYLAAQGMASELAAY
ncbi:MAG TPA: NAD(P)/FAD-dependent oxidoreductase [Saprospiraceae bacterium]|nr:NAD(P)/FAD-dependent oxidoreductase [Saprospiraceae bacterium]